MFPVELNFSSSLYFVVDFLSMNCGQEWIVNVKDTCIWSQTQGKNTLLQYFIGMCVVLCSLTDRICLFVYYNSWPEDTLGMLPVYNHVHYNLIFHTDPFLWIRRLFFLAIFVSVPLSLPISSLYPPSRFLGFLCSLMCLLPVNVLEKFWCIFFSDFFWKTETNFIANCLIMIKIRFGLLQSCYIYLCCWYQCYNLLQKCSEWLRWVHVNQLTSQGSNHQGNLVCLSRPWWFL